MTFIGYIYKITGSCNKVYIGSTTNFNNRKRCHNKKVLTSNSKLLVKPTIFEVIDTREYKLTKTLRLVEQWFLDTIENVNGQRAYTGRMLKFKKMRKRQKKYRDKHKGEIVTCECGSIIIKNSISRHKRSKKHIKLMELLNNPDN